MNQKQVIRMTASSAVAMLVLGTSLVPAAFAASNSDFAGGDGTTSDPYQIATPQQLVNMETDINSNPSAYANASYELTADIDMSELGSSNHDGTYDDWIPIKTFGGTFNGQGHTIAHMTISNDVTDPNGESESGLFGYMDTDYNHSVIENLRLNDIHVDSSADYAGILIGSIAFGTVKNTYVSGTVKDNSKYGIVGGLSGENWYGSIVDSWTTGSVTSGNTAAGLVAEDDAGSTTNSYSTASVSGAELAGGLLGYTYGTISNSYATGAVSSSLGWQGGLIGEEDTGGNITNSFYDQDTTGQSTGIGHVAGGSGTVTAESTSAMQSQSTYTGWDFTSTWSIIPGVNDGYPVLGVFESPTNLQHTNLSDGAWNETWDAVSGASGYDVYLNNVLQNSAPITATSYPLSVSKAGNDAVTVDALFADVGGDPSSSATFPSSADTVSWYAVTYDGNGDTSGNVPTDSKLYSTGESVTLATQGDLAKAGYDFTDWNTKSDGTGTSYAAGDSFTMGNADVALYAQWKETNAATPVIGTQPQDSTAQVGAKSTVSVGATVSDGGTLSYQWYSNSTDSNSGGAEISGATNATYDVPTNAVGVTYYYCVVTNTSTGAENPTTTVTSEPAQVKVTPGDSSLSPVTGGFDKYTGSAGYQDVTTDMTLNGNTLDSIKNGSSALTQGTDYTVDGDKVTILKSYLESQPLGKTTLTFAFSGGASQLLTITVSDSTPAPNAPTNLQHSDLTTTGWTESWDAVSGADSYKVYVGGTYLDTTSNTSYTFSGENAGQEYDVQVTAVAGPDDVEGAKSDADSVTTLPVQPSSLKASDTTSSQTQLTWNAVSGATGYKVYEYEGDDTSTPTNTYTVDPTDGATQSYTATGLDAASTYTFKVAAVDAGGEGQKSTALAVTTLSANAALSGLTLSAGTLSPAFDAATMDYTDAVSYTISTLDVTPTTADSTATVEVNGATVQSGKAATVSLDVGANTIPVVVTAQDGVTQAEYTITVTRADLTAPTVSLSNDAPLSGHTMTVTGTVSDVDQTSIAGATVHLSSTDGDGDEVGSWASSDVTTDKNGQYTAQWTAPTVSAPTQVTVTATVSGKEQTASLVVYPISAAPSPPFINTTEFTEDAKIGVPYSDQIVVTGGSLPYTWSIVSGSLPGGLALDAKTGEITGTPTGETGQYTFTVKVTDGNQLSSTRQLTLSVDGAATPTIVMNGMPPGTIGQSYSQTLSATGGTTPYAWRVVSGTLPAGLSLNAKTGTISGTPTKGEQSTVTVAVTDALGQTATEPVTFDILQPNERAIVWNGKVQNVPAIVGNDSGTQTTFMPIWYVMQLLKTMGIDSTWNGHDWRLTTSAAVDVSNIQAGSGKTSIYLNGTLVQQVNTVADTDPSTNKPTAYMPIWYVQQILQRVGLQSSWDGTSWTVTQEQDSQSM